MAQSTQHQRRIRVALVGCSGLLGDIMHRTVISDGGIEIVANLAEDDLESARDADLVVWSDAEEQGVEKWLQGLAVRPRIVATLHDGREAALWELAPRRTELGEMSPETLLATIHATAASAPSASTD